MPRLIQVQAEKQIPHHIHPSVRVGRTHRLRHPKRPDNPIIESPSGWTHHELPLPLQSQSIRLHPTRDSYKPHKET
jgi:hypothetical protein